MSAGIAGEPVDVIGWPFIVDAAGERRLADLTGDDLLDRALVESLRAVGSERVVEVRPDHAGRARGRERVATAALLLEERLAARGVAALRDPSGARVARGWQRARSRLRAPR